MDPLPRAPQVIAVWKEKARLRATEHATRTTRSQERYLPIADYGVIGDARSIALVSNRGSIDWWCIPLFDGDAVFGRLLDARIGGYFSIEPLGDYEATRSYIPETNILTTQFTTATGAIKVTDFMPALTELQKQTFPIPDREIVRRIFGLSGNVRVHVRIKVRPDYGRRTPKVRKQRDGCYMISWGGVALLLVCNTPLNIEPDGILSTTIDVTGGDRVDFALAYSQEAPAELPTLGSLDLVQQLSQRFWETWSRLCHYRGPYREEVVRSALALKLLTFAPSGAIVAAATTSLPED